MSRGLAEAGATVVAASRDGDKAAGFAATLPSPGGAKHLGVSIDHMDERWCQRGFIEAVARAGHIDILVNNAHWEKVGNVVELDEAGLKELATLNADYGMSVATIGSRIGKIKLKDQPDRSHNKYVAFDEYLNTEVRNTVRAAHGLGTKLVRGFSFYGPAGEDPRPYVAEAVDRLDAAVRAEAVVLFTAHSLPQTIVEKGDPYPEQLRETAEAVAAAAGLDRWQVGWQSAGRTSVPWLGPDLLQILVDLSAKGVPAVVVCPCGFVA
ncbi:MAG: ferrochelatase, partial [Actinobacteria bacterium]|nr:ferrochelatase [Actinomycetota bacterium]